MKIVNILIIGLFITFTGLCAKLDPDQTAKATKAIDNALVYTGKLNTSIGTLIGDDKKFAKASIEDFTEDAQFVTDIEALSLSLEAINPDKAEAATDIATDLSLYIKFITTAPDKVKAEAKLEALKGILRSKFGKTTQAWLQPK